MKLYEVNVCCNFDSESDSTELVVAENREEARIKALSSGYYDMSSYPKEINEIDGYKIILEKINVKE